MESLISVKDLFKQSFDIYVNKFWFFVKLMALNSLAFLLLAPAGILMFFIGDSLGSIITVSIFFALSIVAIILVSTLINVALIISVKERAKNFTLKQVLSESRSIFVSYLWVSSLVGLAVLGGLILFIIPGIVFLVWFVFSSYVLIDQGIKSKQSLAESKNLVKDYWWAVFGRLILATILITAISWAPLAGDIFSFFFGVPFGTIYSFLIYEDLKKIKATKT